MNNSQIKKVNRLKSVRLLLKMLRPYRLEMFFAVISGIIKEASIISSVGICAYMAAQAIQGSPLSAKWLLYLALCVLARGIFTYLDSFLSHDVAYHDLVDYRVVLYDKFEKLCPNILLNKRSGQVATTLMNDVEQLEWFYGHTVGYMVTVFVICVCLVVFMAKLHIYLAVALLISIVILGTIPFVLRKTADEQGLESRHRLGEANSVTLEGINGINEILTLNYRERYKEKNSFFMQRLTDIQVIYAKRAGTEGALLHGVSGAAAIIINLLGIWLSLTGRLSVRWYAVVGSTVWLAFGPVLTFCELARSFGTVFAASERVAEMLESDPVIDNSGEDIDISALSPEIEFNDVRFAYEGTDVNAVDGVSFGVKPGEIIALVGESGAGKTTCTNLLCRLWDISGGSICIGGRDIRTMSLSSLHSMISVVLQDVYLFNSSIRDNIALGKPDAVFEEIKKAAQMAEVHDFIMSLPKGYDTVAGERGVQMSGGQRQRIAIARALLRDSPILILDEAVSSLDTKTDRNIQNTIHNLARKKTILMVAHRLSTILEADRIIVMKHGHVVQTGRHEDLIKEDGYYKELISAQLTVST